MLKRIKSTIAYAVSDIPYRWWYHRAVGNGGVVSFVAIELKQLALELVCDIIGHKLVDISSAGPDCGDMDHACVRCGRHWDVPLY